MTTTPDLAALIMIAASLGFILGALAALLAGGGPTMQDARDKRKRRRQADAEWDAAARAHREGEMA